MASIEFNLFEIVAGWLWHIAPVLFFGALIFLSALPVWLRTHSFGPTWAVIMLFTSALNAYLPGGELVILLFGAIVFGILYVLYRFFVKRREES